MTMDVDDTRTARVRLLRAADSGFAIECEVLEGDVPPAVHGPFPLTFDTFDDRAAVGWFATHFGEPPLDVYRVLTGPILREPDAAGLLPLPPVQERSLTVEVPSGFILPLARVLTPIGARDEDDEGLRMIPSRPSGYRAGREQWLPALHGPGILENVETGEALAFERLRLLDEQRASSRRTICAPRTGWVIGARTVEVVPVGGPVVTFGLVAAPTRSDGADDAGRDSIDGARESDLRLETSVGRFVCRAPLPRDLPVLSRVEPHLPHWLSVGLGANEVRVLLEDLASTSAEHRDTNGRLDWTAFRTAIIDGERVEVLVDEDASRVIAVRYRRRLRNGGAILRTLNRAEGDAARWEDASRSLWELARVGWTERATIAIRSRLTEAFADPWADDVVAALAAGEHVQDIGDMEKQDRFGQWHRDMAVDTLAAFLARLSGRIAAVQAQIEESFDELSSSTSSEHSATLMWIDDLMSELHELQLQELQWRRWAERGQPDELPISSDEFVRLLIAGSVTDE